MSSAFNSDKLLKQIWIFMVISCFNKFGCVLEIVLRICLKKLIKPCINVLLIFLQLFFFQSESISGTWKAEGNPG